MSDDYYKELHFNPYLYYYYYYHKRPSRDYYYYYYYYHFTIIYPSITITRVLPLPAAAAKWMGRHRRPWGNTNRVVSNRVVSKGPLYPSKAKMIVFFVFRYDPVYMPLTAVGQVEVCLRSRKGRNSHVRRELPRDSIVLAWILRYFHVRRARQILAGINLSRLSGELRSAFRSRRGSWRYLWHVWSDYVVCIVV